jgi:cytochrome oxidase Cu insertion factor (SCO1/SenC/PrrC family)
MAQAIRRPFFVIGVILWLTAFCALGVYVFARNAINREGTADDSAGKRAAEVRSALKDGTNLPYLFDLPSFEMINQDGQAVSDATLRGGPVILDFVFTNCAGPCPIMTGKMADLQGAIPDKRVKFVSVSVDPERDTPEVLKEYGKSYEADFSRWSFLTTSDVRKVYELSAGLKLAALPAAGETPIIHSEKFVLVDGRGRVRGYYSSNDPEQVAQLAKDAAALAGKN